METIVEVGGWEHECCGPAYELDEVVELSVIAVPARDDRPARYVETHHGLETTHPQSTVRGRVAAIAVRHRDGSVDQLQRLPSGEALRGFDEHDDGHLERPWTAEPVTTDSDDYLITIAG